MDNPLPAITDAVLVRLTIKPGDALLLQCEQSLSTQQATRLRNYLRDFVARELGVNVPVLVMAGGVRIEILDASQVLP